METARGVALVPSELFELGGVDAAVLGGVERAALEGCGRREHSAVEPGSDATGLDDACDGAGIDRLPADHVGRRPARRRVRRPGRGPEPPEHQPGSDAGASAGQRAHRAGATDAIRNADLHPLARPVSLGDRHGDAQPVLARLEVVDLDAGELAAAERAGEADQQQRDRAAREIVADRREDLAQHGDPGGELGARSVAGLPRGEVEPGIGLGDHGRGGGGGEAAGEMVQIADDGEPQLQSGGRQRLVVRAVRHVALRGEKAATLARRAGRGVRASVAHQVSKFLPSFSVSLRLFSHPWRRAGEGRQVWPILSPIR